MREGSRIEVGAVFVKDEKFRKKWNEEKEENQTIWI
jgi:hypothetical protein